MNDLATSKTQSRDRVRLPHLLLETLGGIAVLGLALWMVVLIGYAVEQHGTGLLP